MRVVAHLNSNQSFALAFVSRLRLLKWDEHGWWMILAISINHGIVDSHKSSSDPIREVLSSITRIEIMGKVQFSSHLRLQDLSSLLSYSKQMSWSWHLPGPRLSAYINLIITNGGGSAKHWHDAVLDPLSTPVSLPVESALASSSSLHLLHSCVLQLSHLPHNIILYFLLI